MTSPNSGLFILRFGLLGLREDMEPSWEAEAFKTLVVSNLDMGTRELGGSLRVCSLLWLGLVGDRGFMSFAGFCCCAALRYLS